MLTPSSINSHPSGWRIVQALQLAHHRARDKFLAVQAMMDEQPHELLGLRHGGGILELAAIQVDEREPAQSYRIRRRFLAFGRGYRAPLHDIEILALGFDRGEARGLARKLHRITDLLQQLELETAQDRLDGWGGGGLGSDDSGRRAGRRGAASLRARGARDRAQLSNSRVIGCEQPLVRILARREL